MFTSDRFIFSIAACLLFLNIFLADPARSASNPYIVINAEDGAIISAHKEYDRWYPASLTKLMTAYVTMKAIQNGVIEEGSPVKISRRAARMPASRMGYKVGTKLRTDTALKILIVKSANDVAVALAESVSGSVEQFADQMNATAKTLGMNDSHFVNPNGLHAPDQYTSARDLAVLARRLLTDFPQYAHWFAIPALRTTKKTHYSYNLLLERYSGTNGMKTGFVCASGYNMVASAKRDGRQLIAVILGEASQSDRAVLAARLLSQAFDNPELLVGNILSIHNSGAAPKNLRPVLCTAEARKHRYEPGAGAAVIKSEFLNKRKVTTKPILISTGNIDGTPSEAYLLQGLIPRNPVLIPTMRPDYQPPLPIDSLSQTGSQLRGSIPVPALRPNS